MPRNAVVNKRNIYHISLIKGTNNECSRNFEISEHIKDSLGGLSVFIGYIVSDGSICSLKYSGHLERELTLEQNIMFRYCHDSGVKDLFS